jgi:hypothetical protein
LWAKKKFGSEGKCEGMNLHTPKGASILKVWSPDGVSNLQRVIAGVKIQWIYRWKALDKGYNFALDLISIGGLHTKLWGPKVARVPILGILGLPFGIKCHLDVGLVERHKVYYKGEGGASPKSRPW